MLENLVDFYRNTTSLVWISIQEMFPEADLGGWVGHSPGPPLNFESYSLTIQERIPEAELGGGWLQMPGTPLNFAI